MTPIGEVANSCASESVMEIFEKLGVDLSLFVQMGIFLGLYLIMNKFVFGPFFRAFEARESLTVGSEGDAEGLDKETEELNERYTQKARAVNARIRDIFDGARAEATAEQTRKIVDARKEAETVIKKTRTQIDSEKQSARSSLDSSVSELSDLVVGKMLGREN